MTFVALLTALFFMALPFVVVGFLLATIAWLVKRVTGIDLSGIKLSKPDEATMERHRVQQYEDATRRAFVRAQVDYRYINPDRK